MTSGLVTAHYPRRQIATTADGMRVTVPCKTQVECHFRNEYSFRPVLPVVSASMQLSHLHRLFASSHILETRLATNNSY